MHGRVDRFRRIDSGEEMEGRDAEREMKGRLHFKLLQPSVPINNENTNECIIMSLLCIND
jgi:hypothetical protein